MKRGGYLKRHTPMKRRRTTGRGRKLSASGLKRKLWKVFSAYIRLKYADINGNVQCVSCPAVLPWRSSQAGHYLPKSLGLAIYFEERNVHPQCPECNLTRQGNQYPYAIYLLKRYGPTVLDELDAQRRRTLKIPEWRYLELIEEYQGKLKALGWKEAA